MYRQNYFYDYNNIVRKLNFGQEMLDMIIIHIYVYFHSLYLNQPLHEM